MKGNSEKKRSKEKSNQCRDLWRKKLKVQKLSWTELNWTGLNWSEQNRTSNRSKRSSPLAYVLCELTCCAIPVPTLPLILPVFVWPMLAIRGFLLAVSHTPVWIVGEYSYNVAPWFDKLWEHFFVFLKSGTSLGEIYLSSYMVAIIASQ